MSTTSSSANISATNNSVHTLSASSVQPPPSFAIRDFLKLLAAGVLSGAGVSVVIAGLTLVLANTAKAGTLQKNETVNAISTQALQAPPALLKPVPGGLYMGGGCDRESVDAVERDWRVKIDNNTAEVRVMQTFLMPADGPTVAFFEATLSPKARLIGLIAHTPQKILSGKVLDMDDFTGLSCRELNKFRIHDALILWNDEDTFFTDQIMNLIPNETVVIEYTYSVRTHLQNGLNELTLALSTEEREMFVATKPTLASGTVWVEWLGVKPKRLANTPADMPADVALEESTQGITGLSWFTPLLAPATRLKLSWEMAPPFLNARTANR